MDNAEEVMHSLEEFSKLKPKDIPRELDDYLGYVAKTGDPVFKWSIIKCLFREKLLNVITDFYESTLTIELPPCPNVDTFNYERMKANLLERLDSFHGAPFTVQRISELLTNPRKEYNRADKFMRAIEKNILVVSIREPGRYSEIDGDNQSDPSFNGIPEPNDSSLETSFTCNDLADPDSSSQVYEVVNSENHDSTYSVNVDTNVVSEIQISVESENLKEDGNGSGTSSDDSQEENIIEISSVPGKTESNNESEKENESVICSTVTAHSNEEEKQNENAKSNVNDTDVICDSVPTTSSESSEESASICTEAEKDTCIGSSSGENLENSEIKKVSSIEKEPNNQLNTGSDVSNVEDELEQNISSVEPMESKSGQKEVAPVVVCGSLLLTAEDTSLVFVDDRPVECDTSNSFDSENNCDPEDNEQLKTNEENITSDGGVLEDNEVSSCVDNLEEKKSDESGNDDNSRETSVIHTTSIPDYTEAMEVEECQISVADQSPN
uniref:Putative serine/threonine-protein phosphatase 4 regulatory subunit 2 n=1 Tax=Panstrongylus megistus TaxID=65343 RepID=A0A069DU56_9HEMI